jgi:hypothetical protein
MRVHLATTDKVNHMTNHPKPLKTLEHDVMNDQRLIRQCLDRYLADELEAKGLNYTTSHYLNGTTADPVQRLAQENIVSHTFKEGDMNYLIDFFAEDQIRSRVDHAAEEGKYIDDGLKGLHLASKERVEKRRKIQEELDKNEREDLKRQLFQMYFRMKEIVKNLNDSNTEDPSNFSEEKKIEIVEALRKYLTSTTATATKRSNIKEDPSQARLKVKSVRDYMMLRSDELKDVIYEEVFFEENYKKNENDEIMKKLISKLEPENYEKFKQIGGSKTKEFMRLLITRQLMMKEERDRVIMKRLMQKKLQEKEEEELRRILNNYQKKEDKSRKRVNFHYKDLHSAKVTL